MERNNHLELTRADLAETVSELHERIRVTDDRVGIPRVSYRDEFDHFRLRIERTNLGYSVTGTLNGEHIHQLNGQLFGPCKQIGNIMLLAAGAPANATIAFFD